WVRNELGRRDFEDVREVQYALVHRYTTEHAGEGSKADEESEKLVRNLIACLRLIRPMRQRTSLMRGELSTNDTINVQHFEHPNEVSEVPEVQKLFHLRNVDLEVLRQLSPAFLRGMKDEFWKFRMAIEFHEAGH